MIAILEGARNMPPFQSCLPGEGRGLILVIVERNENWIPAFAGKTVIFFGRGTGRTQ